jgi:hypothetical protein
MRVTSPRLDRLDKVYLEAKDMRIESLDVPFRGHRTLVVGSVELALQRFSLLESSSAYKGKNILVIQEGQEVALGHPLIFRKRWDVTFRVKDAFDIQLLATYVSNAPKPSRVFWLTVGNSGDIPRALWSRWTHDISLIGCSEVGNICGCEWETILFPLGHPVEKVERVLHGRGSGISLLKELKEHWTELLDAKAAVAWVSSTNSIHWYDPAEHVYDAPLYTKEEAAAVLQSLASWVRG